MGSQMPLLGFKDCLWTVSARPVSAQTGCSDGAKNAGLGRAQVDQGVNDEMDVLCTPSGTLDQNRKEQHMHKPGVIQIIQKNTKREKDGEGLKGCLKRTKGESTRERETGAHRQKASYILLSVSESTTAVLYVPRCTSKEPSLTCRLRIFGS